MSTIVQDGYLPTPEDIIRYASNLLLYIKGPNCGACFECTRQLSSAGEPEIMYSSCYVSTLAAVLESLPSEAKLPSLNQRGVAYLREGSLVGIIILTDVNCINISDHRAAVAAACEALLSRAR